MGNVSFVVFSFLLSSGIFGGNGFVNLFNLLNQTGFLGFKVRDQFGQFELSGSLDLNDFLKFSDLGIKLDLIIIALLGGFLPFSFFLLVSSNSLVKEVLEELVDLDSEVSLVFKLDLDSFKDGLTKLGLGKLKGVNNKKT